MFISQFNKIFSVQLGVPDVHRSVKGYSLEKIFCYKTIRQVRNDYTINLGGGYIQLLKGISPLPRPKQNVTVSKWLNGQMHIYSNGQELDYNVLSEKPAKKGYKIRNVPKDHPWRKMNQKISDDKQRIFFRAALG